MAIFDDTMPANQGIDRLNGLFDTNIGHDHGGEDRGKPISEKGIEDNAISTQKIQNGSITVEKLARSVVNNMSSASNTLGLTNYIADGLKITPNTDLSIVVQPGRASIEEKVQRLPTQQNVLLDPDNVSLIYAQKSSDSDVTIIGKVNAVFPDVETGVTVARYLFNKKVDDITIPDTSGNGNDLTIYGGCTLVDGWVDKAIKTDASTGYMKSSSTNGFSVGTSEREMLCVFTVNNLPQYQAICGYGTASNNNSFFISLEGARVKGWANSNTIDSGYDVEIGKTYVVAFSYKSNINTITINGVPICTLPWNISTVLERFFVGAYPSNLYLGGSTYHYVELRNKCRTPQQLAKLSNQLCLPCIYTAPNAHYPMISDTDKGYHEWRFDDELGNGAADSNRNLPLGAIGIGTPILVNSNLGLGMARQLDGTNYINCGKFIFPNDFTVISIATIENNSGYPSVLGNFNGTNGCIISASNNGNSKISLWSPTSGWTSGVTALPTGIPVFIGVSVGSGFATTYANSPTPDAVFPHIPDTMNGNNLQIGAFGQNSYPFVGNIDYLLYVPRKLSQVEVGKMYDSLMTKVNKNISTDILPANSLSLGFVRTNSNKVIEIDDSSYKYGRCEGPVKGNRQVFLGWKYAGLGQFITWRNPFGTRKIKTVYKFADDANGLNESDVAAYFTGYSGSSSVSYGVIPHPNTNETIRLYTGVNYLSILNGTWRTTGYIGCYAEVID